jgi:hypothetical protein
LSIAVCDKVSAWKKMMKINQYGTGNSKTNSLFWIINNDDVDKDFDINLRYNTDDDENSYNASSKVSDVLIPSSCDRVSTCDVIGKKD